MNLGILSVLAACSLVRVLLICLIVRWLDWFLCHSGYLLIYQVSAGFRMRRSLATESMKKNKEDTTFVNRALLALWLRKYVL